MLRPVVATILLASTGLPFSSQAETFNTCTGFIDAVPAVISTQGVYCLRKDVATSQIDGAAITISANNVTLDCNGYKIGGLGGGPSTQAAGVASETGSRLDNVTVRHCNIRGFRRGTAFNAIGALIENNNFDRNTFLGIASHGPSIVRNNRVLNTGRDSNLEESYGIIISGGSDISGDFDVRGNTVDGVVGARAYGIQLRNSSSTSISNNTVRNLVSPTGAFGIYQTGVTTGRMFVDGNRVSLPATTAGSVGYYCGPQQGALRGNSSWGFETAISAGCRDSGGNLAH